jgi:hypothetical protein
MIFVFKTVVAVEANLGTFGTFLSFANHAIHVQILDVYDDEGITQLCATSSGFVWFPNCHEAAALVVAQATFLFRSLGLLLGDLGLSLATVPIFLQVAVA